MIINKILSTSHQEINNDTRHTKTYKLLVEDPLRAKLAEKEMLLSNVSVQVLNLSGRASTRLRIANISTVEQLINCNENTLLNIPHVGITIVDEIKTKLKLYLIEELDKKSHKSFIASKADSTREISNSPEIMETPFSFPKTLIGLLKRIAHRSK